MTQPLHISSRDNPLLVQMRRSVQDGAAYRKTGKLWIEGEHLCAAAAARGVQAERAVLTETAWQQPTLRALADTAAQTVIVPEALMKGLSTLESAAPIGFVLGAAPDQPVLPNVATVVLDRLQDAGNVGSILRSAAALGVAQVLALKGSVALWSPKVLRAGMGAHFALRLVEGLELVALDALRLPLLATSSHAGAELPAAALPYPAAWVFGHEGQGVTTALLQRCVLTVRIPQPGGEESLNVAAAAAICLYEASRQAQQSGR
jgi:RNA methyltransferase, TrmH family